MNSSLDGRTALVTGAGRGIGRGIALGLAQSGARVGLLARTGHEIDDACAEIHDAGGTGGRFRCVAADLHGFGLSQRPVPGAGGRRLVRGLPARPERRRGHHPVRSVRPAAVVVLAEVLDHDLHLGEGGSTNVFAMHFPTPSVGLITESSSPGGWRLVPVMPDPRPASGSTARGRTRRSRTRRWQ
jgi:NAD(P)-dependent dehydrogenase (short-subunit alcohol dehydrogenase family)